ncbi:MAG: hypothetical protein ACR2N9_00620 [Acidimicrobiia bacterium]
MGVLEGKVVAMVQGQLAGVVGPTISVTEDERQGRSEAGAPGIAANDEGEL